MLGENLLSGRCQGTAHEELLNFTSDERGVTMDFPGTAKIRKITTELTSAQLLTLCKDMAVAGEYKKLWSVLSRVYEDKKGFGYSTEEDIAGDVNAIMDTDAPAELKLQLYTSFELPTSLVPSYDKARELVENCEAKRRNIAAYFITYYDYENEFCSFIISNKETFKVFLKNSSEARILRFFETVILNNEKETITGAIRFVSSQHIRFEHKDMAPIRHLAEVVFASKEVFFTTKLYFCITFNVPFKCMPEGRELDKIIRISMSYEEGITKEFVKKYNLRFDVSDEALCKYFISNKKASQEKVLVHKFACHLIHVKDEETRAKLLRSAFKKGGYFRMYAGCMQDGKVIVEKQKRFRYSDADIEWCSNLPGLK